MLSTLLRYVPKIGPFKAMAFNNPTPQTEDLYFKSINTTVDEYKILLLEADRGIALSLPNCDLDSGKVTKEGEYSLADETYAKLAAQLAGSKFDRTTPELRDNILQFYSDSAVRLGIDPDEKRPDSIGQSNRLA